MRYMLASSVVVIACLAAAQLVTATDMKNPKIEQTSIDIQALTRTVGTLPATVADAI